MFDGPCTAEAVQTLETIDVSTLPEHGQELRKGAMKECTATQAQLLTDSEGVFSRGMMMSMLAAPLSSLTAFLWRTSSGSSVRTLTARKRLPVEDLLERAFIGPATIAWSSPLFSRKRRTGRGDSV